MSGPNGLRHVLHRAVGLTIIAAMHTPRLRPLLVVVALLLSACASSTRQPVIRLDTEPVGLGQLTPEEIAARVQVLARPQSTIYRAPTLQAVQVVDLRSASTVLGGNLGEVELSLSGFLYGVRDRGSGMLRHFLSYRSDYVEGTNRYVSAKLEDGRTLPFTLDRAQHDTCVPECVRVFESLVVQLPDDVVRSVPDGGLVLTVTLDNGYAFPVRVPASYVRGYVLALSRPAP